MPITIKELLASDTISQAADKINFNFDQLILNGGGPVGPPGPIGPIGPIGGRGLRGTQWFEDPNPSPGTNPNTLIFTDVLEGDSYLQSDGTVWEYDGINWNATAVNLTGPQGLPGTSNGFEYFHGFDTGTGSDILVGERAACLGLMPDGSTSTNGATVSNEGVSAIMIGGVTSITPNTGGPARTSLFEISTQMAQSIQSDVVSLFVHQKDTASKGIIFHGGADPTNSEDFEQGDIDILSNIKLGLDDRLIIEVPKPPTSSTNLDDLIGFRIDTPSKSQVLRAGKAINLITGTDVTPYSLSGENDLTAQIRRPGSKLSIDITDTSNSALLELGGNITVPPVTFLSFPTTPTGTFYVESGYSYIYTQNSNNIVALGQLRLRSNLSSIDMNSFTATNITNVGSGGINITQSTSASGDIDIVNSTGGGRLFMRTLNGSILTIGNLLPTQQNGVINIYNNSNLINIANVSADITIGVITGDLIAGAQNGDVNISTTTTGDITVDSADQIRSTAASDIDSTSTSGQHKFTATGKARPSNLNSGNLGFEVNAHVSPLRSTARFFVTETTPAFASGLFQTNPASTSYPRYQQQWVKMGDVVHVNGIIDFGVSGGGAAQNPLNVFIPIPVFNASSPIVPGLTTNSNFAVEGQNLFGHGTWYINGQLGDNTGDNALVPVEIKPAPSAYPDRFYITYPGYASGGAITGGNNYGPLGTSLVVWESTIRFTYTYTLTTT